MTVQPLQEQGQDYSAVAHEENTLANLNLLIAPSLAGHLLSPEGSLTAVRRLVVLIPDQDVDETELAGRIWALAAPAQLAILLIGVVSQGDEAYVRRRLINLAVLLRYGPIRVEMALHHHSTWVQTLQKYIRPGDLIVCHAEQKVSSNGLNRQKLAPLLLTTLNTPIYVLNGFYPGLRIELSASLGQLILAVVPVAIIVGFFFLQIQIDITSEGWAGKALLMLSVLVEAALIGWWEGVI